MRALLAVSVLMLCATPALAAQDDYTCAFRHDVTEYAAGKYLPDTVRAALPVPMADKGEPFNASDDVFAGSPPQLRFMRAGFADDILFVWVEIGGFGYQQKPYLFRMTNTGDVFVFGSEGKPGITGLGGYDFTAMNAPTINANGNLCARTDAILDAAAP